MLNNTKYDTISHQLTKYVGLILYVICIFATIMNIITLSQIKYTRRACSLYLLIASIFDLIHLNLGPLSNIFQYGFNYDWTIISIQLCKIKTYFIYVFTIISGTLTILASINQFMLSSKKSSRWKYGQRSVGIRNIEIIILFWFLISIPILLCTQRIFHLSNNQQLICLNPCRYSTCRFVYILYICLFNGLFPPFIMMIFAFLTYKNISHLHRHAKFKSIRSKKINEQLTAMLILQSIKSTIASIPYSVFNIYWIVTMNRNKSLEQQAKENLISQIGYLLFWSNYTTFFLYIIASDIYRHQWIKAMKKLICCCCCCCCWNEKPRRQSLLTG